MSMIPKPAFVADSRCELQAMMLKTEGETLVVDGSRVEQADVVIDDYDDRYISVHLYLDDGRYAIWSVDGWWPGAKPRRISIFDDSGFGKPVPSMSIGPRT